MNINKYLTLTWSVTFDPLNEICVIIANVTTKTIFRYIKMYVICYSISDLMCKKNQITLKFTSPFQNALLVARNGYLVFIFLKHKI